VAAYRSGVDDGGRDAVTGMRAGVLPPALVSRLYTQAKAERWTLSRDAFAAALERSVRHTFAAGLPAASDLEHHIAALHVADLALAAACADGADVAWEHFVKEYRPALYRAAAAIDHTGGGRELADSLYADLFGLKERDGERQSLFRYFHGRSSLASWVRAVLAQRHVDRIRNARRHTPLPEEDAPGAMPAAADVSPAEPSPCHQVMLAALAAALAQLAPRDRLRLSCYYTQQMKLAAIGRMLGEHEASVSRHLARARRELREAIESHLRTGAGYSEAQAADCFRAVANDSGPLDLEVLLAPEADGKKSALDRSEKGGTNG
jgi:RNA polymerase sigma-70 factor (ECF subfamily)